MKPPSATCFIALSAGALLLEAPAARGAPFSLQGVDPADFRVTTFAEGLNYPKGMQELPGGWLLLATSDPVPPSKGFYSSSGTVLSLADVDLDGVADGPPAVLFSGLPGSLSGLKVAGPLVFVASTAKQISILRLGDTPTAPLKLEGKIVFNLPSGWMHPPSDLAVRESPGLPKSYEVFFQVGSQFNIAATTQDASLSGLISAAVKGDSIYCVTVADEGTGVSASKVTRIATGLRNPAGYAFHPATGDLYFEDNGIDGLSDPNEPLSADELNFIPASALGVGAFEDFGFPQSYTAYRTGKLVGGGGIQPLAAFQPLPDALTGEESEGPSEIAFAPPAFPEWLRGGLFIGFHGKFNQGGTANEENSLVYVDPASGEYFHLIAARVPGVGHLDGLLSTRDSLFVADLASGGSLSSGAGQGVIYRIQAVARGPLFLRGDSSGDGHVDLTDPVATLSYLFLGAGGVSCLDAADANDDGGLDLADPLAVLLYLFAGGEELPLPSPAKGEDPTPDELGCGS